MSPFRYYSTALAQLLVKVGHGNRNLENADRGNTRQGQTGVTKERCRALFFAAMIVTAVCTQFALSELISSIFLSYEKLIYVRSIGGDSSSHQKLQTSNKTAIVKRADSYPKLALLLSFPNSGTSYTLKNLRRVSNTSTATNYCGHSREIIPVFPRRTDLTGPYIIPGNSPHEFPLHYILTKTHCFHCIQCHPSEYLISVNKFEDRCMRTCVRAQNKTRFGKVEEKVYDRYPISVVGKFLHLLRNPFDNIISRFRLHKKQQLRISGYDNPEDWYPFNVTGFREYCKDQDTLFDDEERWTWKQRKLRKYAKNLPCHADWFRLISWHNNAFEMSAAHSEKIETLVLHYDDYRDDFNGTVLTLLKFLDMKWIQPPVEFRWNNYSDFYNEVERKAAVNFVNLVASNETLREIRRYGF